MDGLGRTGRAYRKVRASFTDKPANFGWIIEGRLAASGLPSSAAQVRWLKEHGINSILTLTEDPLPQKLLDGSDVVSLHVQMFDHAPPSQDSLSKAVRHVRSEIEKGNSVVVHCLAGQGRTGSVVAAYMIEYHGKDVDEEISQLRRTRPGSIERSQEPAVREYAQRIKEAKRQQ
ncbi:MAG: dual specificity protein phosphatase family protein [Thaumarchaeota archaeon]|nr:dual specificity protein phosphatase family protein [Nitrososphaerota archaeon]